MKKSLLAVAALTAFAGAAQAQSSVTVYGILDVGYIGGNNKTGDGNAETYSQLGQSGQQSSRLGFKGTEDLGGGMSAFFTIETGLAPQNSTLSGFNNRQAFVGLGKKGLGQAAIGTQYTPIHIAVGKTGANGQNNIIGDLIYPSSSGRTANQSDASSNTIAYTVRANNMIKATSDKFAGFKGTAFYVANSRDEDQTTVGTTVTGGNTNKTGYGLGVDYNWKKLLVTANFQSFKNETNAGAPPAATAAGVNATDNQYYVGATYDFGILKAYAQYVNKKVTSNLNSNEYLSRSAQQIGVRSFITPKIEGWASAGTGRYQSFGAGQPTANIVGFQIGSNYWLSKRTNLYAIYGQNGTSSTTTSVGGVNPSYNANNYGVGVRHTF
jgi:predicted porin